jgi:N-acetylmuramoyl-L-alanine amidase
VFFLLAVAGAAIVRSVRLLLLGVGACVLASLTGAVVTAQAPPREVTTVIQPVLGRSRAPVAPRPWRVVLDPGHGGTNTGCAGVVEGVYEKRVTLVLAFAVAERLQKAGVDVVMTRTDDRFLTLRERVRFANRADADLFLSIHFNASPGKAQRGFETWVLDPTMIDVDARAIRAGDGPERPGLDPAVAAILDDAERGAAQTGSLRLAERLQARLATVWGPKLSRGVRQGSQDVLIGLNMEGALVEVGFLDHPVEGAELLTSARRELLADALAAAVLDRRPEAK